MHSPDRILAKRRSAEIFVEKLLGGPVRDRIVRIVLFGSVARGEPRPESDVDILVFARGDLESVSDACAGAAFDTALRTGESLEPLVLPVGEMWMPGSYFVHHALRGGKELYSMPEEELRRIEAVHKLDLAREFLEGARANLEQGRNRIALDAAYNAAELCIKALLILKGVPLPSTHGGLVGKFGEEYVKTGQAGREVGRLLHRALELRNKARYVADAVMTTADAETVIQLASTLVKLLEEAL